MALMLRNLLTLALASTSRNGLPRKMFRLSMQGCTSRSLSGLRYVDMIPPRTYTDTHNDTQTHSHTHTHMETHACTKICTLLPIGDISQDQGEMISNRFVTPGLMQ